MIIFLLFAMILLPTSLDAEELLAGLGRNRVAISANFDGTEILIFGSVKRDAPAPSGEPDIIVTIEGPKRPVTVRRKGRRAAIWVNTAAMEIDAAPSFYAVNSSGRLSEILSHTENLRHRITVRHAIRTIGAAADVPDPSAYSDALVRVRSSERLYQVNENAVTFREDTLFDTSVSLPANLVEGVYTTRLFLVRNGTVAAQASAAINVEKIGLEKFIYGLAHERPLVYGGLSLAIAIAAGWGASAAFRYVLG